MQQCFNFSLISGGVEAMTPGDLDEMPYVTGARTVQLGLKKTQEILIFNLQSLRNFLFLNIKISDVIFSYYNRNARGIISMEPPFSFFSMGDKSLFISHVS